MSDITLDKVAALGDFLTDEVYEVEFVSIPDGFTGITSEDINLRAQTFTIPDVPVEYIDVTHRTFTKSQPVKRTNKQEASMTMIETATPKTIPFLRDWMNRCALKGTNYIYPPSQRQCEILVYHKRNDRTTAWVYNLKNAQIVTKGERSLTNGDGPQAVIPQISFNCLNILEGPNVNELR